MVTDGVTMALGCILHNPYVKSAQIYKCPSGTRTIDKSGEVGDTSEMRPLNATTPDVTFPRLFNYGANQNIIAADDGPTPVKAIAVGDVQSAALVPMITDCTGGITGNKWRVINANWTGNTWYDVRPEVPVESMARHLGGSNICYADGHVKFLQQGRMVSPDFKMELQ